MVRVCYFLFVVISIVVVRGEESSDGAISRDDFPNDFVFGSGTSAYQVEGAAGEGGRSPSIWDTFAHDGNTQGTGDISSDEYHKYKVLPRVGWIEPFVLEEHRAERVPVEH